MFIIIFIIWKKQKVTIARKIIKNKKLEDKLKMIELAKKFIDKECLISAFDSSHQFSGTIKEVSAGAILIENSGGLVAINLDFVFKIREYPKNKKGKKKSIIF